MIKTIDVIDRLPLELQAWLQADPYFADIPVVISEKGNVSAEIQRAQAVITTQGGKRGVAVIILQVIADDKDDNIAFGSMKLKPAFQIVENVELNHDSAGTKKSARKVARKLIQIVKPLRLVGLTSEFVCDKPALEPITLPSEYSKSIVTYQANFYTYEADSEPVSQCTMPIFSLSPGNVSPLILTGANGETIWYTTDDSPPMPTDKVPSSTAVIYSGPIAIAGIGFTVRTAAFRAGYVASQVNRADISPTTINNQA
jgi:hypothetical protein